ncbi:LysR family transcriptional regulator [Curvivirga aplysinae]|uniref:LysR family transcriptional regulator n=1 Tax=Curvivirga aplysinae TaxID=2529852 RepID=UPI0012BBB1B3|nr:LysR family transcriptional regulator [Curvivirga aplysinae]MTI09550.1 LysR family transcriptional regulator [Curvivirga aplysinae]
MHSVKHMQTFCTVVEYGGFSGAQTVLGMSQPAISTHIRDFEIRLGFQLCHRGRSGFRLTEKGEITYRKCREMLNAISDFDADLGELRNKLTGELRIGVIDSTVTDPQSPLARAINRFYARENEVGLSLKTLSPDYLERELLSGNIHIAISIFAQKHQAIDYQYLYMEDHKFYLGKAHPLFEMKDDEINLETLEDYSIASRSYLQTTDLFHFRKSPNPAFVSNMEALAHLIISGRFMGFLPVHYAKTWVDKGEMRSLDHLGLNWQSEIQLAIRKAPSMQQIVKLFVEDLEIQLYK